MAKQSDFDKFLSNIEPSQSTVSYISSVQNTLRDYLKNHKVYADIYVDSFLSGSYAKHTSIRPAKDDKKRDVDIIIVTNHCLSDDSLSVFSLFWKSSLGAPRMLTMSVHALQNG